ncbi:MAG TPA: DUF1572 family protein [Thermoanaerobaculia bacterium]|nr:DUF1572 family protein [Thermoanaerobaculia bacterium]
MQLADVVINSIRARITRVFPAQIRAALERLTDEQIWWRPNESSNSVGNLVIHLSGSLNHYLNRNIGGIPYDRDRAAEFAERRTIPRAELLAIFDDMVAKAEKTLDGVDAARLEEPSAEPTLQQFVIEDLLNITAHVATHAGQILWVAKMLVEGGAGKEVWIKTHRDLGGWTGKP